METLNKSSFVEKSAQNLWAFSVKASLNQRFLMRFSGTFHMLFSAVSELAVLLLAFLAEADGIFDGFFPRSALHGKQPHILKVAGHTYFGSLLCQGNIRNAAAVKR